MNYALPCSCGHSVAVAPRQAGGSVRCPICGQELSVPKLGQLRQLAPLSESETPRHAPASRWSMGRGIAFALLTAAAVLCFLTAAVSGYRWYAVGPTETREAFLARGKGEFDQMDSVTLLRSWIEYEQFRLGPERPPTFHQKLEEKAFWQRVTWASLAGGVVLAAIATGVGRAGRKTAPA